MSLNDYGHLADDLGRLNAHLNCRVCGYDLHGAPMSGQCPECGEPVENSAVGWQLALADPRWLRSLSLGAKMYAWSWILTAGLIILVIFVAIAVFAAMGTTPQPGQQPGPQALAGLGVGLILLVALGALAFLALLVVGLVGLWKLSAAEPAATEDPTARKVLRAAVIAAIPLLPFSFMVGGLTGAVAPNAMPIASALTGLLGSAIYVTQLVALALWLGVLADRLPDPSLAKQARGVFIALAIAMGVHGLTNIAGALTGANPGAPGGPANAAMVGFGCMVCLAAPVMLVGFVWGLILLFMIGGRFASEAAVADELNRDAQSQMTQW